MWSTHIHNRRVAVRLATGCSGRRVRYRAEVIYRILSCHVLGYTPIERRHHHVTLSNTVHSDAGAYRSSWIRPKKTSALCGRDVSFVFRPHCSWNLVADESLARHVCDHEVPRHIFLYTLDGPRGCWVFLSNLPQRHTALRSTNGMTHWGCDLLRSLGVCMVDASRAFHVGVVLDLYPSC